MQDLDEGCKKQQKPTQKKKKTNERSWIRKKDESCDRFLSFLRFEPHPQIH